MANFNNLKILIQSFEGGYVNDPYDKGGETNKGITIAAWKTAGYNTSEKIPQLKVGNTIYKNVTKSLYEMTDEQWSDVFKRFYWDRWKADDIKDQAIANTLVDWVWASGLWGIKIPQRILGVTQDGKVGNKTIEALNNQSGINLFNKIQNARRQFIDDIIRKTPTNARYKNGWLRRINSFHYDYMSLNNGSKINL